TAFGEPVTLVFQLATFQGVRYALFAYNSTGKRGGAADFDAFPVAQPNPRGLMRPIPYGERVTLASVGRDYGLASNGPDLSAGVPARFTVVDRKLGRVALAAGQRFVSVDSSGAVRLR